MFLLWSPAVCAQSGAQLSPAVPLVREAAAEVRIKLPIQLRLHQHHPQGIEAPASCAVLAIAFSVRSLTGVANDLRQLSDDGKDSKATVLRRINSVNLRVARLEDAFEQADLLVIPEDERFFDKEED